MKRIGGLVTVVLAATLLGAALDALAIEAKKIAQIKADETLWSFIVKIPTSLEAQLLYALVISGLIGMIASWLWKWSQGQADSSHWTKKYVIGQLLWLVGSSVTAIFVVGFQTEDGVFFGWMSVLWAGAFAGFSGDVKVKSKDSGSA